MDYQVDEETQPIILLNSLFDKYKYVKSNIIYKIDNLTCDMVVSRSKYFE